MLERGKYIGNIKGFPNTVGSWCKKLKYENREVDIPRYILSTSQERERERCGFPIHRCQWCTGELKKSVLRIPNPKRKLVQQLSQNALPTDSQYLREEIGVPNSSREFSSKAAQEPITAVQYLGIASDEPSRIERHSKRNNILLPLVEIGWNEAYCRKWCEENDLLSPIYTTASRGGCWFCHNQSVDQLRLLRKNYPDLWKILLQWDSDSPVTFKADGHTVHDFDRRFQAEDDGILIAGDRKFRWSMLDGDCQLKFDI